MPSEPVGKKSKIFISFKSGHYKNITGWWLGDSVWMHYRNEHGQNIHVNKAEIEYVCVTPIEDK